MRALAEEKVSKPPDWQVEGKDLSGVSWLVTGGRERQVSSLGPVGPKVRASGICHVSMELSRDGLIGRMP